MFNKLTINLIKDGSIIFQALQLSVCRKACMFRYIGNTGIDWIDWPIITIRNQDKDLWK